MSDSDTVIIDQEPEIEPRDKNASGITHQVVQRPERPIALKKTAAEVAEDAQLLQQVMQKVMKKDMHYGSVPGADGKVLFKAGAEILVSTFRIAVKPEVVDLSTEDCVRYRVLCHGIHQTSGIELGIGVGECSTDEQKYKWRAAVCDEEYDATRSDRRREKWNKGWNGNPAYSVKQVRTEPADQANTVLKMAKKRALVDMAITATGASDIFVQDLDENGELMAEGQQKPNGSGNGGGSAPRPSSSSGGGDKATEGQVRLLGVKLDQSNKDLEDVKEHFSVNGLEDIPKAQVNDVIDFLKG